MWMPMLLQQVVSVDSVEKLMGMVALGSGMLFSTYRWGVKPTYQRGRSLAKRITEGLTAVEVIKMDVKHIKERTAVGAAYQRCLSNHMSIGIFECDRDGSLSWINETFGELTGLRLEDAKGNGWLSAVVDGDRRRVGNEWSQAAMQAVHAVIYCTVQNRETKREHPVRIDADVIGNGNPVGWVCTVERTDDHVNGDKTLP